MDKGGDKLRAFEQGLRGASQGLGEANRIAGVMMDNTAGPFEQLKGSLETLSIQLFKTFGPELREAIDAATAAVNKSGSAMESAAPLQSAFLGSLGGGLELILETADAVLGKLGELTGARASGLLGTGDGSLAARLVTSEQIYRDFGEFLGDAGNRFARQVSAIPGISFLSGLDAGQLAEAEARLSQNIAEFDARKAKELALLANRRLGTPLPGGDDPGVLGGSRFGAGVVGQVRQGLGAAARWANDAIANAQIPGAVGNRAIDFARSGLLTAAQWAQNAIANATDMMARSIRLELPAALEFGTREAFSAIARFESGALFGGDAKKTEQNTKKTADNTAAIAKGIEELVRKAAEPTIEVIEF